jgi:site-specific recombinase XerD
MHTPVTQHTVAAGVASANQTLIESSLVAESATSLLLSCSPAMEKIAKIVSQLTWSARRKLAFSLVDNLGNHSITVKERAHTLRYLSLVVHVLGASEITSIKSSLGDLVFDEEEVNDIREACALLFLVCAEHGISEDIRVLGFKFFITGAWPALNIEIIKGAVLAFSQKISRTADLKYYAGLCAAHGRHEESLILQRAVSMRENNVSKESEKIEQSSSILVSLTKRIVENQLRFSRIETAQEFQSILLILRQEVKASTLKPSTKRVYLSRMDLLSKFVDKNLQTIESVVAENYISAVARTFIQRLSLSYSRHTIRNLNCIFLLLARMTGEVVDWDARSQSGTGLRQQGKASRMKQSCSLTAEEEALLLKVCSAARSSRDLALVLLFLRTGVRFVECTELQVVDFLQEEGQSKLCVGRHTTGARYEIVDEVLEKALVAWLAERKKKLGDGGYLFSSSTGNSLSRTALDFVIRRIGRKCGLNISYRTLRDTCVAGAARTLIEARSFQT